MTACAACGGENPPGFRFCGHCGAALGGVACPACDALNPQGQRFCGQCGAALDAAAATAPPPREERKLVTVLFADVVGFTSLAESTDHEVVARTVDAAFRRLGEIVEEHGGVVDKYMGDSVMAVFGVPQSHDDDAERAVAAALAMRELPGDLSFSIGVNSGEVTATEVGRPGDLTVIGDTVNVAARLEKAAAPGEVLVGRLTAELAGDRVVFRERRPVVLKGKREPVEVFEAVALRAAPAEQGERIPLVGREDELAFLEAQWRRARRDRRAEVVLLVGDAGCGKSRLVDELARSVQAAGPARVVRTAYPGYGGLGGPRIAADMIRQLGFSGDAEVDTRVRSITGDLHPSLAGIDAEALKQEQLWAMRRLFEGKAGELPVLVVIDDVHRAGASTFDLLAGVAQRLPDVPALIVLAGRPEPAEWLTRFPTATTVRLAPLPRDDAAALAAALAGGLPEQAVALAVERAGGNPLFLRELLAVLASGAAAGTIPVTLQAVLAARLDQLEPEQKVAMQHIAVLGGPASAGQVEALGLADAERVLQSLVDAGLLRQADGATFDAVDPLLREVAYETLPRAVRGERHRAAAGAAATLVDAARHLGRAAAYLPDDGALAAEAARVLATGGRELLSASRVADGMRLLQRAVELGDHDPETLLPLARVELGLGHEEQGLGRLDLLPDDLPGRAAAERDHLRAAAFIFTDPARAVPGLEAVGPKWAELGDVVQEGWAHANLGVALFNLSRMEESLRELERALERFRAAGDRAGEFAVYSFLSLVRPHDPRVPTWLADALAHAEATGDRGRQYGVLVPLMWNAYFRCRLGDAASTADAQRWAQRTLELAEELGNVAGDVQARALLASIHRLTGRLDDAAAALAPVAGAGRDPALLAAVTASLALARDPAAAVDPVDVTADPVSRAAGIILAESLAFAGRFDEALTRYASAGAEEDLGRLGELMGFVRPLALVLAGRGGEARDRLEPLREVADAIGAGPTGVAVRALRAELDGDIAGLPEPSGPSVAGALVLRARARAGDEGAAVRLREWCAALGMPGLLAGLT